LILHQELMNCHVNYDTILVILELRKAAGVYSARNASTGFTADARWAGT
jgi:hypothetical protein